MIRIVPERNRVIVKNPAVTTKIATYQCPADVANLAAVRRFIGENARQLCNNDDFIYDIVLAVDEIVTNIIVHGYEDEPGEIIIEIYNHDDSLSVIIKDNAPLFDPHTAPEPNLSLPLDQRKPGGLGISFVRQLVDRMIYTPGTTRGNQLTLVKRCPDGNTP